MSVRIYKNSDLSADPRGRDLTLWSILAGLILFGLLAGPFFFGRMYSADDLGAFHLPLRAFYAQQLAEGRPHDWMPQLFSGFFLTGEGQAGTYHPLHQLFYRFLPLQAALAWEFLLPYPLMMLGMWLFLRRRLGRNDAAMLGGLVFAFSSFNLLHFVHPNAVAVVAHIPWLLWAIDVALLESRKNRVALAMALIALLTGSQLLLGYPQFVWFSLVVEFAYVVFLLTAYQYTARTGCESCRTCDDCIGCDSATWPRVVIAKGIGLLLGGVQLLPSLDAWSNAARMSADANFPYWGSLYPLNLLQLVAPYMFTDRVLGDSTHEYGLYAGAAPLVLVVWLVARRRELGPLAPLAWAAMGFSMLMLLLSFGKYGFLYRIATWIPVLRSFRFPCRYLVLFQLAVAVLAAIGFLLLTRENALVRRQRAEGVFYRPRRAWLALWRDFEPLWCIVGFSAAVAAVGLTLYHKPYIASIPAILAGPALLGTAAILVGLAARGRRGALVGLIVFAAADLGSYGLSYSVYPKNEPLQELLASVETPPGKAEGRIVASLFRVDEPGLRTGDLITLTGWHRADGYAGLEPARRLDYRLLPALRVAGVRWVKRGPSTDSIAGLKPYDSLWLEVPDPLPRVRLVSRVQASNNPAEDIANIAPDATALSEVPLGLPASTPGTAVLAEDHPGRIEIDVHCDAPQLLVVAESYHAGWKAAVDGQPREVYRIYGDFMGCIVEPGESRVTLTFQPDSLQRGWLATYFGLSMLCVCLIGYTAQSRPKTIKGNMP